MWFAQPDALKGSLLKTLVVSVYSYPGMYSNPDTVFKCVLELRHRLWILEPRQWAMMEMLGVSVMHVA